MARLVVAAAAGIVVGVATGNPVTGFQTFAAVSAVDPPLTPPEPAPSDSSLEQQEADGAA